MTGKWRTRTHGSSRQRGKKILLSTTDPKVKARQRAIRERLKIPKTWRKVSNNQLVYGDFDQDKTPNLDDLKPFDPAVKEQVEEIKRKDQLLSVRRNNRRYRETMEEVAKAEGGTSRIKSEWSTVGKLRRKYIESVQDIAGVRVLVDTTRQVQEKAAEIKAKYKVLAEDDYYKNPLQGYYYAYHITVEKNGFPVEIQVVTRGHQKLHDITHKYYKQGKTGPIRKFRRIARETLEKES